MITLCTFGSGARGLVLTALMVVITSTTTATEYSRYATSRRPRPPGRDEHIAGLGVSMKATTLARDRPCGASILVAYRSRGSTASRSPPTRCCRYRDHRRADAYGPITTTRAASPRWRIFPTRSVPSRSAGRRRTPTKAVTRVMPSARGLAALVLFADYTHALDPRANPCLSICRATW